MSLQGAYILEWDYVKVLSLFKTPTKKNKEVEITDYGSFKDARFPETDIAANKLIL